MHYPDKYSRFSHQSPNSDAGCSHTKSILYAQLRINTAHFSAGEKLAPNEVFYSCLIGTIDVRTFTMICPPQTEPMEHSVHIL